LFFKKKRVFINPDTNTQFRNGCATAASWQVQGLDALLFRPDWFDAI